VDHFHDWFQPELEKQGYSGIFVKKPENKDGGSVP
jgi:mRNA deadenylase 3'-5' endonuclease subunit Ccr4